MCRWAGRGTQTPLKKPRIPPGGVRARHAARAAAGLQVTRKGRVAEVGLWRLETQPLCRLQESSPSIQIESP